MKFGVQGPDNFGNIGPQGFPGQLPGVPQGQPIVGPMGQNVQGFGPGQMGPGASPGGSIRNNLGAGLKNMGVFQKDGQINNLRGGFIGPKQPAGMLGGSPAPYQAGNPQIQTRQFILQAAQQGIVANGIATISPDNNFVLMANLPSPSNFSSGQGMPSYAVYLADKKGQTGFLAGVLRHMGNGVYQTQFRSPVPLHYYERVVVSVENSSQLGQAPSGPIILMVQQPKGASAFINPIKNAGGSVWRKITGLFQRSPKQPALPEGAAEMPISNEAAGSVLNPGLSQIPQVQPGEWVPPEMPPVPPSL